MLLSVSVSRMLLLLKVPIRVEKEVKVRCLAVEGRPLSRLSRFCMADSRRVRITCTATQTSKGRVMYAGSQILDTIQ